MSNENRSVIERKPRRATPGYLESDMSECQFCREKIKGEVQTYCDQPACLDCLLEIHHPFPPFLVIPLEKPNDHE